MVIPGYGIQHVNIRHVDIINYLRRHHQDFANGGVVMLAEYFEKIPQGIQNLKKFHGCFTAENGFMDTPDRYTYSWTDI